MNAVFLAAFLAWVLTILASFALGRVSMRGRRVAMAKVEVTADDPDRFVAALVRKFQAGE